MSINENVFLTPIGNEIRVADFRLPWPPDYYNFDGPFIAGVILPDGQLVVASVDAFEDSSNFQVQLRRFSPDGTETGVPVLLAEGGVESNSPVMAVSGAGSFVAIWRQGGSELHGQLFAPDGGRLGPQFFLDASCARPSVAMRHDGYFATVWQGEGKNGYGAVCIRIFAADGSPACPEFEFDADSTWNLMTWDSDGHLLVVWSVSAEAAEPLVMGQRFTSHGLALEEPFQFNVDGQVFSEEVRSVVSLNDGKFILVGLGGADANLRARTFTNSGTPVTLPWHIDSPLDNSSEPFASCATAASSGGVIVSSPGWLTNGGFIGPSLMWFDADGFPLIRRTPFTSARPGLLSQIFAAANPGTSHVAALWAGSNGTGYAVFCQRFQAQRL